jgi:type IV pilus assembly protein PilA
MKGECWMFQRFHEKLQEREGGFTLIELLVVILIIAILAAIAIPVFLSQREKGWTAQSESALKNLATAYESFATGNNGSYLTSADVAPAVEGATPSLEADEGFNPVAPVDATIEVADANTYCLQAVHDQGVDTLWYSSETGEPTEDDCTA